MTLYYENSVTHTHSHTHTLSLTHTHTQGDYKMKMDNENRVTHINDLPFEPTNTYLVALPRNLLAGFCEIEPLVHVCV